MDGSLRKDIGIQMLDVVSRMQIKFRGHNFNALSTRSGQLKKEANLRLSPGLRYCTTVYNKAS